MAGVGIRKEGRIFNPGFDQIKDMCETAKIPLRIIVMAFISIQRDNVNWQTSWNVNLKAMGNDIM